MKTAALYVTCCNNVVVITLYEQIHAARRSTGAKRAVLEALPEEEGGGPVEPGHVRPRGGRPRPAAVSVREEMHVSKSSPIMQTICILYFVPF